MSARYSATCKAVTCPGAIWCDSAVDVYRLRAAIRTITTYRKGGRLLYGVKSLISPTQFAGRAASSHLSNLVTKSKWSDTGSHSKYFRDGVILGANYGY
jgi:hypothetical protein